MIDLQTLLLGSREVFRPIYNYNFMAKSGFSLVVLASLFSPPCIL